MTPDEVAQRIVAIKRYSDDGDDADAHVREDLLYRDLLSAIAEGRCSDPAECARLALTTQAIDFARWCA
jgi:hypothetical protein